MKKQRWILALCSSSLILVGAKQPVCIQPLAQETEIQETLLRSEASIWIEPSKEGKVFVAQTALGKVTLSEETDQLESVAIASLTLGEHAAIWIQEGQVRASLYTPEKGWIHGQDKAFTLGKRASNPHITPGKKYLPYQPLSTQPFAPVSTQPFAPGGKPAITPPQYSSPSPSNTPIQKLAKGGTVKNVSQNSSGRISSKPRTFARPGGTAKGKKARKSINHFASFENNMALQSSVIATQQDNNNLFEKMIEKFRQLKSLKGDGKEKVTSGGGGGGVDPGDVTVTGGSEDFWLLSLISLYENSNPQGAADVAQSIYNRMANRGQSARQIILSENQYQPVRKFGGYNAWRLVVDKESALAHIKKYPGNSASAKGLDAVAKALLDPSKQADAAKFVGVRPDFRNKGYEGSNDEMTDDKSRLNHTFGFNRGGSRGKITKPASVPSFVSQPTTTSTLHK